MWTTISNIILILLLSTILLRLILWYFKKNSPFLNEEHKIVLINMTTLTALLGVSLGYLFHGEVTSESLIIAYMAYIFYGVVRGIMYLLELREYIPDSTSSKDK